MIQNNDGCGVELISNEDDSEQEDRKGKKVGAIEVLKSKLDKKLVNDVESLDRSSSMRSLKEKRLDKVERKYSHKS